MLKARYLFLAIFYAFLCMNGTSVQAESTDQNVNIANIEGLVLAVSKLADPKKSDYPDCYYIVEFEVKNIVSGQISTKIINLAVPGFINYKLSPYQLKAGNKIKCSVIHADAATQKERSTQTCDDFNTFDRDTYFLRSAKLIHEWSALPLPQFTCREKYVSVWDKPFNPPQSATSIAARAETIRKDLKNIKNKAACKTDCDWFLKEWNKKSAELPMFNPYYYWFQKGNGVFALPKDIKYYLNYDVNQQIMTGIDSFISLNKYLRKQNIDLILVLYPDCFSVALRAFFDDVPNMPIKPSEKITRLLLENDVEVIDLAPHLEPVLLQSEFLFYYYHLNQHPGWDTQDIAGRLTADRLKRYNINPSLKSDFFAEKRVLARSEKYVYPANLPIGGHSPGKPIMTYATFYNNLPTPVNADSQVLLWGNSFLDWPKNQAFMTAVAKYHLNFCDRRHGAGCFTSMIRDLLLSPQQYIKGKKVMVIPVSVFMFRDYKIWNIGDMEKQIQRQENIVDTVAVQLPAGKKLPPDIEIFLKEHNIKGEYYPLPPHGLHINIPEIKTRTEHLYGLKVTYYNQYSLYCQYGIGKYAIASPAQFTIETLTLPYDPQNKKISFYPSGGSRSIVITDIIIEGSKK